MRKIAIITFMWAVAVLKGTAQQAPPSNGPHNFSLQDCINYAYEHQDSVKNAKLDITSADYKVKETKGQGLPQVNGTVSFQDFLKPPASVGPNFFNPPIDPNAPLVQFPFGAVKYNNTFSLQATQLLFSGTFLVGLQAVKTFKELSERSLTRSKIQTNVAVTKAYYQVLVNNEQIRLLDANINQLKQQVNETSQSNKQGFVEKIDVDRITVQYNNLVTNRENVSRSLALGYAMLKFQMGMPIAEELNLTDKLGDVNLTQSVAETAVDTTFYRNRIEYNLLETNKRLNELDVKAKKADLLPTVSAAAGLATVFQENHTRYLYNHTYPNSYVGLNINVPIFSGFQRSSKVKQAEIEVQKSNNMLNNAKNGLELQATAARVTFVNSLKSLDNQKRNQTLANDVLRVSRIKYQQGVGSSIEVTQAQTALETSNNDYIQALYDALINKVNLDQAYGRIK
ncbi:TolC family protein [Mucilaginibacter mali]|uniref:TolC family protein n=1 Tax=Mucilaginibacter mali TaxID=2740462 RepID=A0A7D4TTM3_9SPHI|nr:TolC family protein [Mucilaginibacter mali]QKJ29175.1 TolC family protein [Mucilaginibacter mali]